MKTVIALAGYAKSDSDGFRKVISKKKKDMVPLHRKWFIDGRKEVDDDGHGHQKKYTPIPGGVALGHPKEKLEKIFDEMEDFASYCFNKSHAAAYMVVGKVTAWLMYYYPTEFMAALLTSVKTNLPKVNVYIKGCRDMGIEILPPDINSGNDSFVALPGKKIVYTLSAKSTNSNALEGIVNVRTENYKDFTDFLKKNAYTIEKKTIESLVSIGALNSLGIVRSQILAGLDDISEHLRKAKDKVKRRAESWERYYKWEASECFRCRINPKHKKNELCDECGNTFMPKVRRPLNPEPELNLDLTGLIPDISEFPQDVILRLEKKYLGIYLSGHPLYVL
jgi:DNA polymerase-3 subunit alpha